MSTYTLSPERSLPLAPAPWTCKATVYVLSFYHSASSTLPLEIVYDPFELNAESFSSEKETGKYIGGLGFAQIVRYSESPVGTYDELAILPGFFSSDGPDGKKRMDSRITGIWVSQEATLMNGRRNWNIPKYATRLHVLLCYVNANLNTVLYRHLARFKFTPLDPSTSSPVKVEVFRADPCSTQPFFSASIHPISYLPAFPMSSTWLSYLGISTYILQPPLPEGDPSEVVVGSEDWKRSNPILKTKRAKMVWIDMKQSDEGRKGVRAAVAQGEGATLLTKHEEVYENWWPGMRRWHLGMILEDAILKLGEPKVLNR